MYPVAALILIGVAVAVTQEGWPAVGPAAAVVVVVPIWRIAGTGIDVSDIGVRVVREFGATWCRGCSCGRWS